ncbi:MAG: hypothetical protein CMH82_05505 [Nocardioides sp.]|nr:hypothetical protein [Nocardioides sp.]
MPDDPPKIVTLPAEELLTRRGITDWETGVTLAEDYFLDFVKSMRTYMTGGGLTAISFGLMTLLTKAQAFHSGACAMIREDNPYASYALIRSYAENAAALHYMANVKGAIDRYALGADKKRNAPPKVGVLVDYAKRNGLPGFRDLYDRLSEYTHPDAAAFSAGHRAHGETGHFQWSSAPHFKTDEGKRWAALWLMELTDVHKRYWGPLFQATSGAAEEAGDVDNSAGSD